MQLLERTVTPQESDLRSFLKCTCENVFHCANLKKAFINSQHFIIKYMRVVRESSGLTKILKTYAPQRSCVNERSSYMALIFSRYLPAQS